MIGKFQNARQKILLASCAVFALSAAQSAFAQAGQGTGIETVVVTAEKRSENIQNVPAGVSAVSSDTLASLHATQLTDIGSYVPSLQVNSAGTPGQTMISIRGIAPVGPGATVATYIDDVPVGSSSAYGGGIAFALDLLPYDVDRLEVLRGPQGTLYGASSMGGLLKYVLTTPSLDTVEIKAGADGFGISGAGGIGGGARATVSAPLVDGKLGFTASYAYEKTPGYIDNFVTGQKNENGFQQQSARVGFLWQPNENLTFKLNAMYQQVDADGDSNVVLDPTTLHPLGGWLKDDNLVSQPFHKNLQFYSLSMDYAMGWADLISASSYQKTTTSQTQDDSYQYGVAFPYFGLPFAGLSQSHYKLNLEKYTQEVRLQSPEGNALEWLAGVFFTSEDSTNFQSPSALTPAGVPIPGIDPIYIAHLPSTYTEYAAFGNLTYHFTDAFKIFGGVRYSYNDQVFSEIASSAIFGTVDLRNQKSNEGVTTFNAGAQYNFSDHSMAYVRVASGYQPGGPNLAIPGVPSTFNSDTLTNYEAGVKSQFFDDRILLDVDAFYIDWKDIQLLSNGAGFSYGANGGTAKSQGFEANASFEAFDGFMIDGTFSYIDAVLTQDVPVLGGLDGDRLPNIPRYSGSLRAEYTTPLASDWALTVGGGVRFVGSRYSDVNHAPDARRIPGYTALDLNANVSDDRYTVRLFVKNVTNSHGYLTFEPQFNQATGDMTQVEAAVLQPRTIGLSLDVKF